MGFLFFIFFALLLRIAYVKRGPGPVLWVCIALTFVASLIAVFELQVMVPDSWTPGLWIIGVTGLMLMVVPLPVSGRTAVVARVVIFAALCAYPVWLGLQMGMVYSAIQSGDPRVVHERVDFETMREGVERQLSAHFEAVDAAREEPASENEGVLAVVTSKFLSGARKSRRWLVKKVARSILTPQGLKRLVNQDTSGAMASSRPWNERLRIEEFDRWKIWTENGWVGFERDDENRLIRLRSIEFSEEFLDSIETIQDDVS